MQQWCVATAFSGQCRARVHVSLFAWFPPNFSRDRARQPRSGGAEGIFATTTPIPASYEPWGEAQVLAENQEALTALHGRVDAVDDLHAAVIAHCGANYTTCDWQKPANVHYTILGRKQMGHLVAESIRAVLKPSALVV